MDPHYSEVIKDMQKNKTVCGEFSLDTQGILYRKMRDHDKEVTALIVLTSLQRYVLCDSHMSIRQNGKAREYYWKVLKRPVQQFVRHCHQCQTIYVQTPKYALLKPLKCWWISSQ